MELSFYSIFSCNCYFCDLTFVISSSIFIRAFICQSNHYENQVRNKIVMNCQHELSKWEPHKNICGPTSNQEILLSSWECLIKPGDVPELYRASVQFSVEYGAHASLGRRQQYQLIAKLPLQSTDCPQPSTISLNLCRTEDRTWSLWFLSSTSYRMSSTQSELTPFSCLR